MCPDSSPLGPMQVGTRATVKVSFCVEYVVEIEMPPDGDPGRHADLELFLTGDWDDYVEKDVLHTEILDSEPVYEDEYESEDDWPTHA